MTTPSELPPAPIEVAVVAVPKSASGRDHAARLGLVALVVMMLLLTVSQYLLSSAQSRAVTKARHDFLAQNQAVVVAKKAADVGGLAVCRQDAGLLNARSRALRVWLAADIAEESTNPVAGPRLRAQRIANDRALITVYTVPVICG